MAFKELFKVKVAMTSVNEKLERISWKRLEVIDVTASYFMLVLLEGSQCLAFLPNCNDASWLIEGSSDGGVWELYIFY